MLESPQELLGRDGEVISAQAEYERRLGRLGQVPQALDHLYFGYMLML